MKLTQILFEESQSFNLNTLKNIPDIENQRDYLENVGEKIGEGTAREVYSVGASAIKLAKPDNLKAGQEQNKAEYDVYTTLKQTKGRKAKLLVPKVYFADETNFNWIIVEVVDPITDFIKALGLGDRQESLFRRAMVGIESYDFFLSTLSEEQKPFFLELKELIDTFNLEPAELLGDEQWGRAPDNRIVLIDSGLIKV